MFKYYLLIFSTCAVICELEADLIFTSPLRTRALLSSVDLVIKTLQEYIKTEKDRVKTLEGYLDDWEKEHNRNAANPEFYLGNHISLFNFLKKLHTWWPYWQEETKKNSAASSIHYMRNSNTTWPTMEDMTGVMDSIINIQMIHDFQASSIVKGNFYGISTNSKLDFEECLMMAKRSFDTNHYDLSSQWALTALQKYFTDRIKKDEKKLYEVFYYISYTFHIKGEYDLAVDAITAYVNKNPDDEKAKTLQNIIHLKLPPEHKKSISKKMEIFVNIKNLCNKITTEAELSRISYLRCRYNHKNSNYLRIAPLKEEILSIIPQISLFRDALYDSEIEFLKEKSKERLQEVVMENNSDIYFYQVESANFEDHECDEITRISHRINHMVLSRNSSKGTFQLHKYKVGGAYADYEEKKVFEDLGKYGTILFHMSDVALGGSTIFPQLNIAIKPEKGTALVWFDDIQRQSNDIIRHSICSVLVGYNWTFTKRIFEKEKSNPERRCGKNS